MREFQLRLVTVHADISPDVHAQARHKIGQLAKLAPEPVLFAKVKFEQAADPAVERPAIVQATLDVNGRLVRASVTARQFDEAVDLVEARLRQRLEHLTGRLRGRRRRARRACRAEREHPPVAAPLEGPRTRSPRPREMTVAGRIGPGGPMPRES